MENLFNYQGLLNLVYSRDPIRCWSPLGVKGLTLSFKGEVFTFNNQLFRSGNKVKAITSGVPYNFSLLMQCEMQ